MAILRGQRGNNDCGPTCFANTLNILGYDKVVYDSSEVFNDWSKLPGGEGKFRRVLLTQGNPSGGGFTKLSGDTYIELVQDLSERKPLKIYDGRLWGDIGFVHLGFDVRGMKELGEELDKVGFGFTCDTKNVFRYCSRNCN